VQSTTRSALHQVLEEAGGFQAGFLELRRRGPGGRVKREAFAYRELRLEVGFRLCDAGNDHVVLKGDRIGNAFPDRPISVDRDLRRHERAPPADRGYNEKRLREIPPRRPTQKGYSVRHGIRSA